MTARKSNEDHVSAGTFRADRHGSPATATGRELVKELPAPPEYFRDEATRHWTELGHQLVREEKLTNSELHMLATACKHYSNMRYLENVIDSRQKYWMEELQTAGFDDQELKQAMQEWRAQSVAYQTVMQALGMGAVARSQASIVNPKTRSGGVPRRPQDLSR